MQSEKTKYPCTVEGCKATFNRPYRLTQHHLRHISIKPFKCEEKNCSKSYSSKSHLDRHINSVHKQEKSNVLYCCPVCVKSYTNRQNLKRHMKKNHSKDEQTYICDYCSEVFKMKHQISAHMYQHTGVKAFKCSTCFKQFPSIMDRNKHMRNHKVYTCEHCERKYNLFAELIAHKRTDHCMPEYICNDCGKSYKDRLQIIRHVKIHMNVAVVTVFYCPYKNCLRHYTRNNNLQQHIKLAHGTQVFECTVCSKRLSSKAKLRDHTERHYRPGVIVRNPMKTLDNGRKKRKDMNTVKVITAMKLAGLDDDDVDVDTHTQQYGEGTAVLQTTI